MRRGRIFLVCLLMGWGTLISADAEQISHWDFQIPSGSSYGDTITASVDTVNLLTACAENVSSSSTKVFYAAPNPDLGGASADIRGGAFLKVSDNPILTGYNDGGTGFSALTIDAYVYLRALPQNRANPGVIVRKTGMGSNNRPGYQFYVSYDGKLSFTLADGVAVSAQGSASSPAGAIQAKQWYHVTGTWDGAVIRVYIDGFEVGSKVYAADGGKPGVLDADTVGALCIGGWQAVDGTYAQQVNGIIDDVTIYNEAAQTPPSKRLPLVYPGRR